jgi:hypothetical protein
MTGVRLRTATSTEEYLYGASVVGTEIVLT